MLSAASSSSVLPPGALEEAPLPPSTGLRFHSADNEHGDGYNLDGCHHRGGYGLSPGKDSGGSGAVPDEGLEAAAAAAGAAAVAAAVARGHQLRAAGAFNFYSAPTTPVGMPPSAAAGAPALPSVRSFFAGEAGGGGAAPSRRGRIRSDSEEAAPLEQTVVATVAGSPDVSSEGPRFLPSSTCV